MVQLSIYTETPGKDRTVSLRLIKDDDGEVDLVVVDDGGAAVDGGYLLSITSDGTIAMYCDVSSDLGFSLDKQGHVKVTKE